MRQTALICYNKIKPYNERIDRQRKPPVILIKKKLTPSLLQYILIVWHNNETPFETAISVSHYQSIHMLLLILRWHSDIVGLSLHFFYVTNFLILKMTLRLLKHVVLHLRYGGKGLPLHLSMFLFVQSDG